MHVTHNVRWTLLIIFGGPYSNVGRCTATRTGEPSAVHPERLALRGSAPELRGGRVAAVCRSVYRPCLQEPLNRCGGICDECPDFPRARPRGGRMRQQAPDCPATPPHAQAHCYCHNSGTHTSIARRRAKRHDSPSHASPTAVVAVPCSRAVQGHSITTSQFSNGLPMGKRAEHTTDGDPAGWVCGVTHCEMRCSAPPHTTWPTGRSCAWQSGAVEGVPRWNSESLGCTVT